MSFSRKAVLVLLIAILAVGILYIGIKNNKAIEEGRQLSSSSKVETVYFWYSDDELTDFFTNAAVAFHEKNSDVRVIPVLVDSIEYLEKINEASLEGEDFPDAYLVSNDSLEKAYLSGLASVIKDEDKIIDMRFPKGARNAVTYHGNAIAYPLFYETSVLMYNRTYLEEWIAKVNAGEVGADGEYSEDDGDYEDTGDYGYGDEFDDIEDYEESEEGGATEIVTVREWDKEVILDDYIPSTFEDILLFADEYEPPDTVEGVFKWDVTDVFYNYLFVGNYLNVGGEAGDNSKDIDIDNDKAIECMKVYQSLNQYFSIDASQSSYDKVLKDFFDGKYVFTIATSDAIAKANQNSKEKAEEQAAAIASGAEYVPAVYEFGYCVIPDVSSELKSKSLSVTNCVAINGYSEVKDAANRFANFVTTTYSDHLYNRTGKLASSFDAQYQDDSFLVFMEEYAGSMPLPKIVEASNLWVQLEITFTDIWGGADVTEKMQQLKKQLDSQLGY